MSLLMSSSGAFLEWESIRSLKVVGKCLFGEIHRIRQIFLSQSMRVRLNTKLSHYMFQLMRASAPTLLVTTHPCRWELV